MMIKKNPLSPLSVLFFLLVSAVYSFSPVAIPVTGTASGIYQPVGRADNSLTQLIDQVSTSQDANLVTGIFQYKNIQAAVVQQPAGQPAYVSTNNDQVTQFGMAAKYGTTALLAHNYLEGQAFFNVAAGDKITLIYGDGHTQNYKVTAIKQYQALSPTSTYSKFIDLDDPSGTTLTSTDLFNDIYTVSGRLVLQTCIEKDGQSSWGRLFIIAEPVTAANTVAMN